MKTSQPMSFRPCLVMGYVDSVLATQCARMLRRQGWEVHYARRGADVLELTRRHAPDVVLVDAELGNDVAIQTANESPRARVVVLGDAPQVWQDNAITYIPRNEALDFVACEILVPQWVG